MSYQLCAFTMWLSYSVGYLSYQLTMAPAFHDSHITYYHMDVQWSTGLAQTYFTNPDYSIVQCWVHAIFIS